MAQKQIKWAPIVARANEIVESFDTPITLRRLFYLLVSEGVIENKEKVYSYLSEVTTKARRKGEFPELIDLTFALHKAPSWSSPASLLSSAASQYRRDRTAGQKYQIYVGVEKNGLPPDFASVV